MMSEYEKLISEIANCDISNEPCDNFALLVEYLKSKGEKMRFETEDKQCK